MVRVGIAGMGFMGQTHLEAYGKREDVRVVALADRDPARRAGTGDAVSNIQACGLGGAVRNLDRVKRYAEAADLIRDPDVDLVDICLPTPAHGAAVVAALAAGKHLLVEKPLARTAAEARALAARAEAAASASAAGPFAMPAMCMRFWPGWTWLKRAVEERTYGRTLGVVFQRLGAALPGDDYRDGARSGGAILDMHVHDTDFVQHLFGLPRSVTSHGYSHISGGIDHVVTRYACDGADLVVAEAAWIESAAFRFVMRYTANFERGTAVYDLGAAADSPLTLYVPGREPETVPLEPGLGYDHEIAYLIDCIREGRKPDRVTLGDAAAAVRIIEAESESVKTGAPVPLD
jgi:predicted dehydrogenase